MLVGVSIELTCKLKSFLSDLPFPIEKRNIDAVEELGEMMGATVLLWATYELVRSHGVRLFACA